MWKKTGTLNAAGYSPDPLRSSRRKPGSKLLVGDALDLFDFDFVSDSHLRAKSLGRKYSSTIWVALIGKQPTGKRKIRGRSPGQQPDRPNIFLPTV